MGLFRKKNVEETEPAPEKVLPRDETNWREWAALGRENMAEGNLPKAIQYWTGAIGCFDDSPKYYAKFREEILALVFSNLDEQVKQAKIIPAHMMAELDAELRAKRPELMDSLYSDDVFYHVKENISDAGGPEETAMMYICAAYSVIGFLRYSVDMAESFEKCQEVVRLGNFSDGQCLAYKKGEYVGRLKPGMGSEFISTLRYYFEYLSERYQAVMEDMGAEKVAELRAYREEHTVDFLPHLSGAMHACIYTSNAGRRVKKRAGRHFEEEIAEYFEEFRNMNEPV